MQNYCKTIGALAAASALAAGNASAIELEYELHTGYSNQYIFRGVEQGENLVEVGADVATEYNGIGLSAGVWYGSFNGTAEFGNNPNNPNRFIETDVHEIDLYAEASKDFGFATAAVGYIAYTYNNVNYRDNNNSFGLGPEDTQEVYFSLSRDFGFAAASLTYFWDVDGDNNGYTELGLSRSFELSPCLALNLSTTVGFAIEEAAFTPWTTKVALDWGFAEHAKLSPFVALSVGGEADSGYESDSTNELIGGSMLSVSF